MRHAFMTALCATVLGFAAAADAAFLTRHYDPVQAEVDALLQDPSDLTRRQRRGLGQAATLLGRPSPTLLSDVRLGSRVTRQLDRPFRADPRMADALDSALDGHATEVRAERQAVSDTIGRLPASRVSRRAGRRLAAGDRLFGRADAAATRTGRARLLLRALRALLAADRVISRSGQQPLPAARPGARLFKSGPIQITADGAAVWVANTDNDSVSRIATATEQVTEYPLPAADGPHAPGGLSVREDGSEVWVACHDSDCVYVLDGTNGAVLERIDLPWGSGALSVALSRDQTVALVTLNRAAAVALVDTATRAVTDVARGLFDAPNGIAWTEDGRTAWISHRFAGGEHPLTTQITVVGGEARVTEQITTFATQPQRRSQAKGPNQVSEGGYQTQRGHVAQVPSASGRNELWLPTQYNNIHPDVYSPDSTVQATIRHLRLDDLVVPDTNQDKVVLTAVDVHDPTGSNPYQGPGWNAGISGPIDIAFSDDGSMAYVVCELSNDVVAFPTDLPAVRPAGADPLPEIGVGHRPTGIAMSPKTDLAYVVNRFSRGVSVLNLSTLRVVREVPVTPTTGEPFTAAELTGARLFHTSDDPRVSGNQKVSCASCHIDGEHDGRDWGFHALPGRHGPRSTPSLKGLGRTFGTRDAVTGFGQLHVSGDRDEVQDFEHTFRGPNMGGTGFLGNQAQPELGAPNAGRDADLDAIAEYLLELEPLMRSPYRTADGSLSEAAIRGATFFVGAGGKPADADCASCHVPETGFADGRFHDVGQRRPGNEQELNQGSRSPHQWKVNTKTLVGVWTTAPYEGVSTFAPTMAAAVEDFANRSGVGADHGTARGLTRRQRADLVQFLLSIDGNTTAAEVRGARDVHPPRVVRVEPASLTAVDVWFSETVDQASAQSPGNWRILDDTGADVPVLGATWDPLNGDRVTLTTSLPSTPGETYTVVPGPIPDIANTASDGAANALDTGDPTNAVSFTIGTTLTITLGASGYENLTIPVHDAAMVGSGLSTWSHDRAVLFFSGSVANKGFVRFDWRDAFTAATGVADASDIVDARFSLTPAEGSAREIEARRCLQPWADSPTGGDWNKNADGSPTWRDHQHPNQRWNTAGARKRTSGVDGDDPADYGAGNDLAWTPDAIVQMTTINARTAFSGTRVRDAFRFWFDNPALDHGYALELTPGQSQSATFHGWETDQGENGPVLTITYSVPAE